MPKAKQVLEFRLRYNTDSGNKSRIYQHRSAAMNRVRRLQGYATDFVIEARLVPNQWAENIKGAERIAAEANVSGR